MVVPLSASCSGKGLAAHLEVPLPYLLCRVNTRFQEEIQGLEDISGALSPTTAGRGTNHLKSNDPQWPAASHCQTPFQVQFGVRARLSSLGGNSVRRKKRTSSSTIAVQAPKHQHPPPTIVPRSVTPTSSDEDSEDEEDEEALKEEEADRKVEEQDALDRKLQELQQRRFGPGHFKRTQRVRTRTKMATDIVLYPEFGSRWVPPPRLHVIHPEQQHESKRIQRRLSSGFDTRHTFTLRLRWWFAIPSLPWAVTCPHPSPPVRLVFLLVWLRE